MTLVLTIYSIIVSVICIILSLNNKELKNLETLYKEMIQALNEKIIALESIIKIDKELVESHEKSSKIKDNLIKQLNEELDEQDKFIEDVLNDSFGLSDNNITITQKKDLEEFRDQLKKQLDFLKDHIESNTDKRVKEIGDRVQVWDLSLALTEDGERYFPFGEDVEKRFDMPALVIEKGLSKPSKDILGNTHILDLLVEYQDGKKIYTKSEFVKRSDNYEK